MRTSSLRWRMICAPRSKIGGPGKIIEGKDLKKRGQKALLSMVNEGCDMDRLTFVSYTMGATLVVDIGYAI